MPIFALLSLLAVVAAIAFGVFFTARLFGRLDQLESGRGSGSLADEVERLRLEVGELQTEIDRMTERMDFTEKLLQAPHDDDSDEGA